MARSGEALQRRALKRNRTVQEQQQADLNSAKKQRRATQKQLQVQNGLTAPGSWTCPSCQQVNFPSRYVCRGLNCQQERPSRNDNNNDKTSRARQAFSFQPSEKIETDSLGEDANDIEPQTTAARTSQQQESTNLTDANTLSPPPPTRAKQRSDQAHPEKDKSKRPRHDPATSKEIQWSAPQADASQIEANTRLRLRYLEDDPSLTAAERERAQILLARDERKQQKKRLGKQQKILNRNSIPDAGNKLLNIDEKNSSPRADKTAAVKRDATTVKPQKMNSKHRQLGLQAKQQHDANQALLEQYSQTQGKGMSDCDVTRAQHLLARKARKEKTRKEQNIKQRQDLAQKLPEKVADNHEDLRSSSQSKGLSITGKEDKTDRKEKKEQDKKLRKQFETTGGKAMLEDDISRAKALVAKKE